MKFIFALAIILLAKAEVTVLNNENFNRIVDGSQHVFVKFFAPWCGHCKKLAPEYIKLSETIEKPNLVIAEIDCDNKDNKDVCGKYGISGFPTLKLFTKGSTEPIDYNGGRTVDDMKEFINEKTQPKIASSVISLNEKSYEELLADGSKNVFIKFFAPWCGHCKALAPKYEQISRMYAGEEDLVVAEVDCTVNSAICEKNGVQGYPTLKSFPKGSAGKAVDYNGGRDVADFVKYFNNNYGYDRDEEGRIGSLVGRIAELDEIAKTFVSADNKEELIQKAEEVTGGNYYVKTMKRVVERGNEYIEKEITRINKMLESPSLKPKKVDDFNRNLNVLKVF
ncbi:protein disulfide-isomerase [Entamoeba marina]